MKKSNVYFGADFVKIDARQSKKRNPRMLCLHDGEVKSPEILVALWIREDYLGGGRYEIRHSS
jgi:hypothetical protein